MLNSTKYKITTAPKNQKYCKKTFVAFKLSNHVFSMVINVELPASHGILTFMRIKSLCSVKHKKVYNLSSGPEVINFFHAQLKWAWNFIWSLKLKYQQIKKFLVLSLYHANKG